MRVNAVTNPAWRANPNPKTELKAKAAIQKGPAGTPKKSWLQPAPNTCSNCTHFTVTSRTVWGKCNKFGTPAGMYGKACEAYQSQSQKTRGAGRRQEAGRGQGA